MSLATGARAGVYEIVSKIGAGGMGAGHRGRDPGLDRDVAIQALPAGQPAAITWMTIVLNWSSLPGEREP